MSDYEKTAVRTSKQRISRPQHPYGILDYLGQRAKSL